MAEIGEVTALDFPAGIGAVADLAPVGDEAGGSWLVLDAGGLISRWGTAAGTAAAVARTSVAGEPDHQVWLGHELRRRLHASASGRFAAVVNDYGRFGEVIDLRAGRVTMVLDNGGSDAETVPFSLAFACHRGQDVVIHRTAWNRLDVSDPATGRLLTARGPTSCRSGEATPEHYLDYFHGALYLSPDGVRIFDDGWFWQPVGIPAAWELATWLDGNAWESEDGPTKIDYFCWLEYWDRAVTWIGSHRIAIEDIGDDKTPACTRIFDLTQARPGLGRGRQAAEISNLRGPEGRFFSDGTTLFSSSQDGLARWDPRTGARTGFTPGFTPAYYHPTSHELLEVTELGLRYAKHT